MKCPHSSQSEKAVEGGARDSEAVRPPSQLLDEGGVGCHNRAADDVAVSVEVLGGRVNYEVGTKLDRPLQHRREKCIVHGYKRPDVVPGLDHQSQVCYPE